MSYIPTGAEFLLVIGGIGLVGFCFLAGERVFGSVFSTDPGH